MTKSLKSLVECIGLSAAIYLTRAWGGRALYVPREAGDTHPITLAIGFEASRKLSEAYPSTQINVPAERHMLMAMRDRLICEAYTSGESVRAVALTYGVSRKWVHLALERAGIARGTSEATKKAGAF